MANTGLVSRKVINITGSGTLKIADGEQGWIWRMLTYTFTTADTNTVQWKSGTTPVTGAMDFAAKGGISTGPIDDRLLGHFDCAEGEDVNITTTADVNVQGHCCLIKMEVRS